MKRFWDKVDRRGSDECWEWQAYCQPNGRPKFSWGGQTRYASRVVWELTYGPIPEAPDLFHGICVCHTCDNPKCVNPKHLFLATQSENIKDREQKGRGRPGRPDPSRVGKLTEEQVREIRRRHSEGWPQVCLAQEFKVHAQTISSIVLRKTWAGVAEE